MSNSDLEAANKGWFKKLIENSWLRICLELVAFVLLISKVIPGSWLKTEWPFLALITLALAGLLISNYMLTSRLISEVKQKKLEIENITSLLEKKSQICRCNSYA